MKGIGWSGLPATIPAPTRQNDYIRERTCTRKRAFSSLDLARMWAGYLDRPEREFDAYRCVFCSGFHISKKTMTPEQIDNLFSYHPPKPDQIERYNLIRFEARKMAHLIIENTPASPEQTLAIRSLSLAVMQANAAIAVNE